MSAICVCEVHPIPSLLLAQTMHSVRAVSRARS